ncbi:MAG: M20 family metallopeptidase [Candidatus Cloacimonetes bacterium]|nr:M20 family metallopeptidase [Candidatus Cloacimonadota bacterium]
MVLNIVEIRRDFHKHPELAFAEERTAKMLSSHLQTIGLKPCRCAKTGVVAEIIGDLPGSTIALRADIDALPVQETSGLPYASVNNGVSHACGHDVHMAVLLGAAEILMTQRAQLAGRIRLLFQPAEETASGAQVMIEEGVLEGVKAIFGLHNEPFLAAGKVGVQPGPLMAAAARFDIDVIGKGGHAAMPQNTNDPILAAAAIVLGLQSAVSRVIDPLKPAVISVAQFHAGTVYNVIPDGAQLKGTVRYFHDEVGEMIPDLMQTIITGIASGYRCNATLRYQRSVPPVVNDANLTNLVWEVAHAELGANNVCRPGMVTIGEDFAYYQQQVPGCFFRLGSAGMYGLHHPSFTIDEDCLQIGARVLAQIAKEALA